MKTTVRDLDTVIIAVPSEVEIEGKKFGMGNLKYAQDIDVDNESLMIDKLFNKKNVPKEFVYGYVHTHNGKCELVKNLQHFSKMESKQKEEYITKYLKESDVKLDELKPLINKEKETKRDEEIESGINNKLKEELSKSTLDKEELVEIDIKKNGDEFSKETHNHTIKDRETDIQI